MLVQRAPEPETNSTDISKCTFGQKTYVPSRSLECQSSDRSSLISLFIAKYRLAKTAAPAASVKQAVGQGRRMFCGCCWCKQLCNVRGCFPFWQWKAPYPSSSPCRAERDVIEECLQFWGTFHKQMAQAVNCSALSVMTETGLHNHEVLHSALLWAQKRKFFRWKWEKVGEDLAFH